MPDSNDVHTFARAIAQEIDGAEYEMDENPSARHARIRIGGERLSLSDWRGEGKCEITISIADVAPAKVATALLYSRINLPRIAVSLSRDPKQAARDIQRRLVDAAREPLAALRERIAQHEQTGRDLDSQIAAYKSAFPFLDIGRQHKRDTSANVFGRGIYLHATLYANGNLSIQRIDGLDRETAFAVLKVLENAKG